MVRLGNRVGVARIHLHQGDPNLLVAEGKGVYNVRLLPVPGLKGPRRARTDRIPPP